MTEQIDQRPQNRLIGRTILIGMGIAIISATSLLLIYLQTQARQVLISAVGNLVAFICLMIARRLIHREKPRAVRYWVLGAILIAFDIVELVISDGAPFSVYGGVVLIGIAATTIWPRRQRILWLGAALHVALVILINLFEPFPRYSLQWSVPLAIHVYGTALILTLILLWRLYRAYDSVTTIRSRLLIISLFLTALPATTITATFAFISFRSGQQGAIQEVDLVAALQTKDITAWTENLQRDLGDLFSGSSAVKSAERLVQESPGTEAYQVAYELLRARFQSSMDRTELYNELFLLNPQGYVVLSTEETQEGGFDRHYSYFQEGSKGPYLQPPFHGHSLAEGGLSIVVSQPVINELDKLVGVVAGRASVDRLTAIVSEQTRFGQNANTYLISSEHVLLSEASTGLAERYHIYSEGADAAVDLHRNGAKAYQNHKEIPVLGAYRWNSQLQVALLVEQDQALALRPIYAALLVNVGIGMAGILLVVLVTLAFTQSITASLATLAETAEQVAAGNLDILAPVGREDETGVLARSFNIMTLRLRDLIGGLEQRVADRTQELEQRSAYLEAAAEVSHAVTSILDPDELAHQVVESIRERFDLYYVGLFLVDPVGQWAELRAGTGEAGRAMLARGHRIQVGTGMIGWSVAEGEARIASEAGDDSMRLRITELPHTRSEAAIPLRSRGQVIGALSVQDSRPDAFDQETIAVFQTMADQVAVAMDNAQLFKAREAAMEAERRAHGIVQRQAWSKLLQERTGLGFRSDRRGISPAKDIWLPEMEKAAQTGAIIQDQTASPFPGDDNVRQSLAVPIKIRDKVIAVLDTYKPADAGGWTEEEIAFLKSIADQLGVALENARLYEATQLRVERESTVSNITAQVRAAGDMDSILRTAVHEIRRVLGATHGIIRLGTETHLRPPTGNKPVNSADEGADD